jgi:hypothetical protein
MERRSERINSACGGIYSFIQWNIVMRQKRLQKAGGKCYYYKRNLFFGEMEYTNEGGEQYFRKSD